MILLLQFPEGLKRKALEYAETYRKEGHEVFLSSSPCFGACDIALEEAKTVHANKIIHFGHSEFVKESLPIEVEYIEFPINLDIKYLENILHDLESYNTIAIATTVQYVHKLEEIRDFFESKGKTVLTSKGSLASHEGQILGCDASAVTSIAKDADAILFIGDGLFHPLAITLDKPVFTYNPYSHVMEDISERIKELKKRRKGMLAAAVVSKSFGILVSTKLGQFNLSLARIIRNKLKEKGKHSEILIGNTFDSISLENFQAFDCYITTACPRLSEDFEQFEKPILDKELFNELMKLL